MAKDIYDVMNTADGASVSEFLAMFNDGTGFDFAYTCGKNVGGKTAASPTASSTVKSQFEDMFTVLPIKYIQIGLALLLLVWLVKLLLAQDHLIKLMEKV